MEDTTLNLEDYLEDVASQVGWTSVRAIHELCMCIISEGKEKACRNYLRAYHEGFMMAEREMFDGRTTMNERHSLALLEARHVQKMR